MGQVLLHSRIVISRDREYNRDRKERDREGQGEMAKGEREWKDEGPKSLQ